MVPGACGIERYGETGLNGPVFNGGTVIFCLQFFGMNVNFTQVQPLMRASDGELYCHGADLKKKMSSLVFHS